MSAPNTPPARRRWHTAGLFDVRTIIGGLLTVYGVILLLMGIFADQESEKTGDVNANLWTGIALIVVGVVFLVWVRLRPIVVSEHAGVSERPRDGRPPGH